jgi:hypothetical protein
MVAGAIERDPGFHHPMQRVRQRCAGRVEDRGVEQPGRSGRRRGAALALPGVEADVVVIAAGRDERRAVAHPLHQLEAEHVAIEAERAVEIGDLEMDMPDTGAGDDRWVQGHGCLRVFDLDLSPLAGRGWTLREAESPGEGVQVYRWVTIRGESPSPQPSESELRSSRPREEPGAGEDHARSETSPSGNPNSNVFNVIDTSV